MQLHNFLHGAYDIRPENVLLFDGRLRDSSGQCDDRPTNITRAAIRSNQKVYGRPAYNLK